MRQFIGMGAVKGQISKELVCDELCDVNGNIVSEVPLTRLCISTEIYRNIMIFHWPAIR